MEKKNVKRVSSISRFFSRFLVLIIITLSCLIVLKSNAYLRGKIYRTIFESNIKFPKINELYEKYFGTSLPLTGDKSNLAMASFEKINYTKKEKYKDGVKLTVTDGYATSLLRSGIVVFAGEKEGYGNTVIVEDSDDVEVWYCNLKDIKVEMYDYLKKGSIIGETNGDSLILVFTKEGEVLDYNKYI